MSTLVLVGNGRQPFTRLLNAVVLNAQSFPQPVIVQYGHTPFKSTVCHGFQFIEMSEFERLVEESELIICHGGVGTILHALHHGKVPIVIPRRRHYGEIIDDHQLGLVRALSESRSIIVVEDVGALLDRAREAAQRQLASRAQPREIRMIQLVADALRKA